MAHLLVLASYVEVDVVVGMAELTHWVARWHRAGPCTECPGGEVEEAA